MHFSLFEGNQPKKQKRWVHIGDNYNEISGPWNRVNVLHKHSHQCHFTIYLLWSSQHAFKYIYFYICLYIILSFHNLSILVQWGGSDKLTTP